MSGEYLIEIFLACLKTDQVTEHCVSLAESMNSVSESQYLLLHKI